MRLVHPLPLPLILEPFPQVCYWLMRQRLKCQITACDTFRSGAVEQLRVHANKLEVPLFESGYGQDPSRVARAGIAKGQYFLFFPSCE